MQPKRTKIRLPEAFGEIFSSNHKDYSPYERFYEWAIKYIWPYSSNLYKKLYSLNEWNLPIEYKPDVTRFIINPIDDKKFDKLVEKWIKDLKLDLNSSFLKFNIGPAVSDEVEQGFVYIRQDWFIKGN